MQSGRTFLLWRAWRTMAEAYKRRGRPRRAAKFFRRALWALEGETVALPPALRSTFLAREEAGDLWRSAGELRAEDTAMRLARRLSARHPGPSETWQETALAWAETCAAALGADAVRIQATWPGARPDEVVFGKPRPSDDAWTLPFGARGSRPGTVTFFRRAERGSFLPVTKRIALPLVHPLAFSLAQGEREGLAKRFERLEKNLRNRAMEAETALVTARRILTQTQVLMGEAGGFAEMVGTSKQMQEVYQGVRRWAPTEITVLVVGESGTGKELAARAIHASSKRSQGPYFAVNCAALAESLLESELFGHEKGAFTGADETRPGLFELASGGTLVLDEVADMSPRMQAQLLRVLEEKVVRRVGGAETFPVDTRAIALSNRPLQKEVKAGRFRQDLYHRLNGAPLKMPSLRERKEDIPLLAKSFLTSFRGEGESTKISREVAALLMRYHWPGNVRELRNMVHRAAVLARNRALRPQDFQGIVAGAITKTTLADGLTARLRDAAGKAGLEYESRWEDLLRALATGGSIRRAEYERLVGISTRTAARDLERLTTLGFLLKQGRGRGTIYKLAGRRGSG
ncbi:MAG: sigma-54 interaction domain-containing protein, partial [Planctomycetota bacterium]|jgi:DNA-binding NtrC family response regulator